MSVRTWLIGGAGALVVGTAVAFAAPALASTTTTTPTPTASASASSSPSTPDCNARGRLGALWAKLPEQLRNDLKAARALPAGAERKAAFETIKNEALDGHYGTEVQTWAKNAGARLHGWFDRAPAALKQDVRAALQQPAGSAREAALKNVADKAAAGDYGTVVKDRAEKITDSPWWKTCVA